MTEGDNQAAARAGNDNRHPPLPVPPGGFRSNEDEADWLAATITMRLREVLAAVGINATPVSPSLRDLLLASLDAASARGSVRRG